MGFPLEDDSTGIETTVTAFVRLFFYMDQSPGESAASGFGPIDVVLMHQVRSKPDGTGKEIRSRFWFGPVLVTAMRVIMDPLQLGHDLSVHAFNEMSHVGTFLPQLFEEMKDDIPTV